MRPESDYFTPTEAVPHPELWKARDSEASEQEVGDFLYGLVRLVKPRVVLETGCYLGDTTRRIGEALEANGLGECHSCDTDAAKIAAASEQCGGRVTFYAIPGVHLVELFPNVDLAFIDSGGDRYEECRGLKMSPGGLVVLHDARWKIYESIRGFGWTEIFFSTPRGISLFKVN